MRDKAFNIAKNPKYDRYRRGIASMVYKCFDKKSASLSDKSVSGSDVNIEVTHNEQLAKPIIRNFKKRTVYSGFNDNIWGVYLADMQSLSKYKKGMKYLLCTIDLFSKCAWGVSLKDKKGVSIVDGFQKILKESNRKPNKIWVYKGSEF